MILHISTFLHPDEMLCRIKILPCACAGQEFLNRHGFSDVDGSHCVVRKGNLHCLVWLISGIHLQKGLVGQTTDARSKFGIVYVLSQSIGIWQQCRRNHKFEVTGRNCTVAPSESIQQQGRRNRKFEVMCRDCIVALCVLLILYVLIGSVVQLTLFINATMYISKNVKMNVINWKLLTLFGILLVL